MEKRLQTLSYVEKDTAAPCQKRAFGIYDQLLVELRQEDPSTFSEFFSAWILSTMKSLQVSEEESGSTTPGLGSPWKKVSS